MNITYAQQLERKIVGECAEGELAEVLTARLHLIGTAVVMSRIEHNNLLKALIQMGQERAWLRLDDVHPG